MHPAGGGKPNSPLHYDGGAGDAEGSAGYLTNDKERIRGFDAIFKQKEKITAFRNFCISDVPEGCFAWMALSDSADYLRVRGKRTNENIQ